MPKDAVETITDVAGKDFPVISCLCCGNANARAEWGRAIDGWISIACEECDVVYDMPIRLHRKPSAEHTRKCDMLHLMLNAHGEETTKIIEKHPNTAR